MDEGLFSWECKELCQSLITMLPGSCELDASRKLYKRRRIAKGKPSNHAIFLGCVAAKTVFVHPSGCLIGQTEVDSPVLRVYHLSFEALSLATLSSRTSCHNFF